METEPTETTVRDELTELRRITKILDGLDARARARAVAYLADRYSTDRYVTEVTP